MSTAVSIDENKIANILRRHGVTQAAIFGSFSRKDANQASDLDLLVTYKPGTTLFDAINLQEELEQALGKKVDLVSQKYLSPRLAKRIKHDLRPLAI